MGRWLTALAVTMTVPPLVASGVVRLYRWWQVRSSAAGSSGGVA